MFFYSASTYIQRVSNHYHEDASRPFLLYVKFMALWMLTCVDIRAFRKDRQIMAIKWCVSSLPADAMKRRWMGFSFKLQNKKGLTTESQRNQIKFITRHWCNGYAHQKRIIYVKRLSLQCLPTKKYLPQYSHLTKHVKHTFSCKFQVLLFFILYNLFFFKNNFDMSILIRKKLATETIENKKIL